MFGVMEIIVSKWNGFRCQSLKLAVFQVVVLSYFQIGRDPLKDTLMYIIAVVRVWELLKPA